MRTSRIRAVAVLAIALVLVAGAAGGTSVNHYGRALRGTQPTAYWRLGQWRGKAAYPRAGRFVGSFKGAPRLGKHGLIHKNDNRAPLFDGKNDRVTINGLTSRSKASWSHGYTLEAWVTTMTTSAEGHILAFNTKNGGNGIALFRDEPTNRFKFHDCEGSGCAVVYSKTIPVIGKIYQVVVTVDRSNRGHLYINGKSEASFKSSKRPLHSARFSIGAEYDCCPQPTSFWHGKIDEVAVYKRALPAARVAAQWAKGT